MGMFDEVVYQCDCGDLVRAQSGECNLEEIPCDSVPIEVLGDLERTVWCRSCGAQYDLHFPTALPVTFIKVSQ